MSLSSFISDLRNSLTVSAVQAEAAPAEQRVESQPEENAKGEELAAEQDPEKGEEKEEKEEEEEEEEDEPQDPAPAITEECINTKECKPYKHHFDECVERVNSAADGGPKEDCVEEFFHVLHCANTCSAPRLWSKLK
ncbi:ubiquinol--cytochrome-c reductase subunit 6 [Maublancomyces gigas]|uniref:Ubiquinol--cytochrome-c reductase subunit 6 n=1 Tax=Discina gigas TaxID=1032678 RepID=A0ABR3GBT1_9PEZI